MDRDLIGYAANPPNPHWPGEARLALNFVLNFEEGSEPSVPDGDAASEWGLTENGGVNPNVPGRDLSAEGMFAYGSRVGFWRIMRLFAELYAADDGVRLRPGAGTPSAGRGRHPSRRPRRVLSRLALGEALRTDRGRGTRPHPARRRLLAADHG